MIMAFIDEQRDQGRVVESVCKVLREQGCQVAARTYRAWTFTFKGHGERLAWSVPRFRLQAAISLRVALVEHKHELAVAELREVRVVEQRAEGDDRRAGLATGVMTWPGEPVEEHDPTTG